MTDTQVINPETTGFPEMTILEDTVEYKEPTDGNKHYTHIINPPNNLHIWTPGMDIKDLVTFARINRIEVVALCGYKFVPELNPDNYDACQICMDVAGMIMRESGE